MRKLWRSLLNAWCDRFHRQYHRSVLDHATWRCDLCANRIQGKNNQKCLDCRQSLEGRRAIAWTDTDNRLLGGLCWNCYAMRR